MASEVQNREGSGFSIVTEIDGVSVPYKNILGAIIRESIFDLLPRIELRLIDSGFFSSQCPIRTGGEISVWTSGKDDKIPPFTFEILSYASGNPNPNVPEGSIIDISGVLKVPEMYGKLKSISYPKTRFSDVVKQVAADSGIESEIGIRSSDSMTWCRFNETGIDFLRRSISNAFITEKECPVLFADKRGVLRFDGLYRASGCDTCVSLAYDKIAATAPLDFDMASVRKGKAKSRVTVPFSSWSRLDVSRYSDVFGGGEGSGVWWYDDGSKKEILTSDGIVSEKRVFGRLSQNVHKNYFKSVVNNRFRKNSIFSEVLTLTTGVYGFEPLDRVHIDIPETSEGGKTVPLSGEYMIFQVVGTFGKDGANEIVCAVKVPFDI